MAKQAKKKPARTAQGEPKQPKGGKKQSPASEPAKRQPRRKKAAPVEVQAPIPAPVVDESKLEWLEPVEEDTGTGISQWRVWYTKCRRYRVVFSIPTLAGGDCRFAAANGASKGIGYDYKDLEHAIRAVEQHHARLHGLGGVRSNSEVVIKHAGEQGTAKPPDHLLPASRQTSLSDYDPLAMPPGKAKKPAQPGKRAVAAARAVPGAVGKPKRAKVLGKYSAGAFARWLGSKGVGLGDARGVLDALGVHLSDVSLAWELRERRPSHPPAQLTGDEVAGLAKQFPQLPL